MKLYDTLLNELFTGENSIKFSTAIEYLCFNMKISEEINEDEEGLPKELLKKVEKDKKYEKKMAKKNSISELTGTIYSLSTPQKNFLRYLKKEYGKKLIKDIKQYRENTLAPYQIIKKNFEETKALYPKMLYSLSKEQYNRAKKSAEKKILNMEETPYEDLERKYLDLYDRKKRLYDSNVKYFPRKELSQAALNKVFKRYGVYSYSYNDEDFKTYRNKIENLQKYLDDLENKLKRGKTDDVKNYIETAFKDIEDTKKFLVVSNKKSQQRIADKISDLYKNMGDANSILKDVSLNLKEVGDIPKKVIDDFDEYTSVNGKSVTSKSFAKEYEMFLIRELIVDQIKNSDKDTKYTKEYDSAIESLKDTFEDRRKGILKSMAGNRNKNELTDIEKSIYKLKKGKPENSDNLSDYELAIKPEYYFEPIYFGKNEEVKEAEKVIDAEMKRFERGLKSKISLEDFKKLKDLRLINNLEISKAKRKK